MKYFPFVITYIWEYKIFLKGFSEIIWYLCDEYCNTCGYEDHKSNVNVDSQICQIKTGYG